ncbi:MAG: immunoglobulin domain-containing protein [Kouleothrix sp.]|nr:immunoglobulin domain-containing protein [Kouleothrix sp.]
MDTRAKRAGGHRRSARHAAALALALLLTLTSQLSAPRPALAAGFTVTKTADTNDGACDGDCSLREAIVAANASAGADTITLPAGSFTLTRSGVDNTANNGDLDVTGPLTINGAGQGSTIIEAGSGSSTAIDRVFSFNPLGTSTGFAVALNNLTIRNGKNPNAFATQESDGGCFDFDGGSSGLGSLNLTSVTVSNCETTDGYAGGVALFLTNGGSANISGATIQNSIASRNSPSSGNGGGLSVFCVNSGKTANLTISNSTIQNNSTRSVGGTNNGQGGGLFFFGACAGTPTFNYQLHHVTITGNSAGSDGGGIYSTAPLTIDNAGGATAISGNSSGRSGGGIWLNHTSSTSNITKVTISGNSAADGGGGIRLDSSATGNVLNLSFSRIVGNTAGGGKGSGLSVNNGTANAANNWWGCSTGPSAAPCDTAKVDPASGGGAAGTGSVTSSPWLRLSLSANPAILLVSQTSALTASFSTNSAGADVSANVDVLKSLPVTWSAVLGTLSGAQTTIQSNGTATATFTAGATGGNGGASAQVDNQSLTAAIEIDQPPGVTAQPTGQSTCLGGGASFSAAANGFPAPTVQWQESANGATFADIGGATATTYSFTPVAGQDGHTFRAVFTNKVSSTASTAASLTVNLPPSITTDPASQSVSDGQIATFTAAASGKPTPGVQWQRSTNSGADWSDIPGATSATLSFTAQLSDDGNQYRAVFTNACSSATSAAAALTVTPVEHWFVYVPLVLR